MGKPNTIKIDEVEYVRADTVQAQAMSADIRIVILHRGFVYVGRFEQEGQNCILRNAKNVRRWGTTRGLGELALSGPLEDTVLDECGMIRFHELGIINQIDCANVWASHV